LVFRCLLPLMVVQSYPKRFRPTLNGPVITLMLRWAEIRVRAIPHCLQCIISMGFYRAMKSFVGTGLAGYWLTITTKTRSLSPTAANTRFTSSTPNLIALWILLLQRLNLLVES